jgi:hypothetical protein
VRIFAVKSSVSIIFSVNLSLSGAEMSISTYVILFSEDNVPTGKKVKTVYYNIVPKLIYNILIKVMGLSPINDM